METGGNLEAKGVKPEATAANNGEQGTNDSVSKVKVTVGGIRPPRLSQDSPKPDQIAAFCKAYNTHREQIEIANEDGGERTTACLRELVSKSVQAFVCYKWYRGKPRAQLTDEELRVGLYRMAGIDGVVVQVKTFKNDMYRILKMDPTVPVRDRVQGVQQALISHITTQELEDTVMPGGVWRHGYGKIVVDAMVSGVAPEDFRRDVRDRVEFDRLENNPQAVMALLDEMVKDRTLIEEGMRRSKYMSAGSGSATGGNPGRQRGQGLKGGSGMSAAASAAGQT